jgi:hypothetical protein
MNPLLVKLERNEVNAWTVVRPSVVRVSQGALWLTRTGDPADSVLEAGQHLRLRPGRWVAQSLGETRYSVEVITVAKEVGDGKAPVFPVLQRL